MNRSDKDPARRPNGEAGDAITDDFAPGAGEDAGDDIDTKAEQRTDSADPASGSVESESERALAEQQDKYLRLAAEYDNYRKRSVRERQEASLRGQAELLRGLLDALDDLSRFAHVDPATTDPKTFHEGVDLVERKVWKELGAIGVTRIDATGVAFDPNIHEAVTTQPAPSKEQDHTVGQVLQAGYKIGEALLRPARVIVLTWQEP